MYHLIIVMTGDPETITVSSSNTTAVADDVAVRQAATDATAATASATAHDPFILLDTEVKDVIVIAVTVTAVLGRSQGLVRTAVRVIPVIGGGEAGDSGGVIRRSSDGKQLFTSGVIW